MSTEITNLEKIRRLPWQVAGNSFNAVFCVFTFFGSVFVLFLSELKLDKTRIGFLLSLMPFCGLLAPFIASWVARVGFKRVFLMFFGFRKCAAGLLLLTPMVFLYAPRYFHFDVTFYWIIGIVLFFAVSRAIAETAIFPWSQEMVPNYLRGKFGAVNTIFTTIASISAMAVAGCIIGHYTGLNRFLAVFGAGTVAGILSVWCFFYVPGGAPITGSEARMVNIRSMRDALYDSNFRTFMIGLALVNLGIVPIFTFSPLFMKEQIGISSGTVIYLDIASYLGMMLTCYLWGWASDRYGSKPIMLTGLSMLVILPVFLLLLPRHSTTSVFFAAAISFYTGMSNMGWGTGFGRYLYVSAVPNQKKTAYMAVFYAWAGLVTGTGPLVAGRLLDLCQSFTGNFLFVRLDPFVPVFLIALVLTFVGLMTMSKVRSDGDMPVRKFVGMFLQGNPIVALESLVRYNWARDEADRVSLTERMGDAKNPLSSNELIEALSDPSFSVRYEAIVSISRLPPDPQLVDALLLVLVGNEPDLSIAAAWALGKLGDKSAILPLRETLLSEFELLHAHSARALAKLGDVDSIPYFLERLRKEPDSKVRLAFATALGTLRATEATGDLLALLRTIEDPILRGEIALAMSRMIGPERYFIQLWRSTRTETGTALAQFLLPLTKELAERKVLHGELLTLARDASARFAEDELVQATALLSVLLRKVPADVFPAHVELIIRECAERLTEFGPSRLEYVLLSLHALHGILQGFPQTHSQGA